MFSSRNIHFAILGLILGGSAGYIVAFYNAQSNLPSVEASAAPAGHPDVGETQMLDALRQTLRENPNQPELVTRYAMTLFDLGRQAGPQGRGYLLEAETWFAKAVQLAPADLNARSLHGIVLWELGRREEAAAELEAGIKQDPAHIPSLHGLFLMAIETGDKNRASQMLQRMEKADPGYEGLSGLKTRFQESFGP